MKLKKKFFRYFVELTGNPLMSSLLKSITESRLSRPLVGPFAKVYHINQNEMAYPIEKYSSLQAFFTRDLKDNSRPIDPSPNTLISPVDGFLSGVGLIDDQHNFQIKNRPYSIEKIFGDEKKAARYKGGYFYVLYLSPSHYHHFHYPVTGTLISRYALGNISYPVNNLGLSLGNSPFTTNYRLLSEVQTSFGKVAIVKVGALNVNSIQIRNSSKDCVKGEEFGYFSFGSTVILFVEKNINFKPTISNNSEVKLGQSIGEWLDDHSIQQ